MEESKILVARDNDRALVEVFGRGSFQNAHLLKSFYNELLKSGTKDFIINLKNCTYLDSTFLGTLAGLGIKLRDSSGKLKIVNVSTRNIELLQNLGLDRIFSIEVLAAELEDKPLQELKGESADKAVSGQNMLEAHETLMNLDPRNVAKFKDVVAYLKEDLGVNSAR